MPSKTLVCCNVLDSIRNAAYMSHTNFWYRLGKLAERTGDQFLSFFPYRMSIDAARNQAAKIALDQECDYILFYDDDSYIHADTYESLKASGYDIVMAHTYIRGVPFHPMFFKEIARERGVIALSYMDDETRPDESGVLPCAAVGFSTCLIKTHLLNKVKHPYFVTGSGMTEDVYFCLKATDAFPEVKIGADFKVAAGHILNPEIVSLANVEKLRKFYGVDIKKNSIGDHDGEDILKWIDQLNPAPAPAVIQE